VLATLLELVTSVKITSVPVYSVFSVIRRFTLMITVANLLNAVTNRWFFGLGVLIAVTMESTIFWDMTPCPPIELQGYFRGTNCLSLQDGHVSQAKQPTMSMQHASLLAVRLVCTSVLNMEICNITWRKGVPSHNAVWFVAYLRLKSTEIFLDLLIYAD
jgi:hypothetical protein